MSNNINRLNDSYNVILPEFYNHQVKKVLTDAKRSLESITDSEVLKSEPNQAHRKEYVEKSWFSFMPTHITIGNTYNMAPFSYLNLSQTHNDYSTNTNYSTKEKTEKEKAEEKEKNDKTQRLFIGIIALITTGFACYFVGKSTGELVGANQDLEDLNKLAIPISKTESQYKVHRQYMEKPQLLEAQLEIVNKITKDTHEIFSSIRKSAQQNLMLRATLAGGAAIMAIGAFTAQPLIMAGGIIGGVGVFGMLIKAGVDKACERRFIEKTKEAKANIQVFLNIINQLPKEEIEEIALVDLKKYQEQFNNTMPQRQHHHIPVYFTKEPIYSTGPQMNEAEYSAHLSNPPQNQSYPNSPYSTNSYPNSPQNHTPYSNPIYKESTQYPQYPHYPQNK